MENNNINIIKKIMVSTKYLKEKFFPSNAKDIQEQKKMQDEVGVTAENELDLNDKENLWEVAAQSQLTNNAKSIYKEEAPAKKQHNYLLIGFVGLIVVFLINSLFGGSSKEGGVNIPKKSIVDSLELKELEEAKGTRISNELNAIYDELKKVKSQNERLEKDAEKRAQTEKSSIAAEAAAMIKQNVQNDLAAIQKKIEVLSRENNSLKETMKEKTFAAVPDAAPPTTEEGATSANKFASKYRDKLVTDSGNEPIFKKVDDKQTTPPPSAANLDSRELKAAQIASATPRPRKMTMASSKHPSLPVFDSLNYKENPFSNHTSLSTVGEKAGSVKRINLPTGTTIKAITLSGFPALAGESARHEPIPALARIKGYGFMPNGYKVDLRECFLSVNGFGDISTERAYIRSRTISCILKDKSLIDTKIDSVAVDESGQYGIKGDLISKQGQIVSRTMLASVAESISTLFQQPQIPTSSTDGEVKYQSLITSQQLTNIGLKGTADSLSKVTDFLLKRAEKMEPYVDIPAGVELTFTLINSATLTPNGKLVEYSMKKPDADATSKIKYKAAQNKEEIEAAIRARKPNTVSSDDDIPLPEAYKSKT